MCEPPDYDPDSGHCECGCGCDGPDEPPYRWVPRAKPSGHSEHTTCWADRPWQFYGLTQACAQLRAEFLPLWLRGLSIRLTLSTFPRFVDVFLSKEPQHISAPKIIQISWIHSSDNYSYPSLDRLTPLIKLRAHCPEVRFEFIPYEAADEKAMPGDTPCDHCLEMRDRYDGEYDSWNDFECECDDPDMSYQEWIWELESRMAYTGILQAFLGNENKTWAKDILEGKVTARWMNMHSLSATFKILCTESFCHSVNNLQGAWNLLKGWGILDLPRRHQMEIILAFEESEKMVIDGLEVKNSLVREFRVPKARLPTEAT